MKRNVSKGRQSDSNGLWINRFNGIENFWNQAKRHLRRFNGIPKDSFYGFLKECEWRFNGGSHKALLNQLKSWYQSEINKP